MSRTDHTDHKMEQLRTEAPTVRCCQHGSRVVSQPKSLESCVDSGCQQQQIFDLNSGACATRCSACIPELCIVSGSGTCDDAC